MLLRSVRVENFRAVKSARISFEGTTVLIGENDCGRSSVMEAIALALGWNSNAGEFLFKPFHAHRSAKRPPSATPAILIALEFAETVPEEWSGEGFEVLRELLPAALSRQRRFWFEVTNNGEGPAQWAFRTPGAKPLNNNLSLLAWLRRSVPVLWITGGMLTAGHAGATPNPWPDERARRLADQVSQSYRDLLEGTALDVPAAIEEGAAAAKQLLLAEAGLLPDRLTRPGEVFQEIAGKRKVKWLKAAPGPPGSSGAAAYSIGLLLLVGSVLRSGAAQVRQGVHPLTLIENPEAHLHPMTLASAWSIIERIGGQKIVATHSGTLLASARLSSVRRLTRHAGIVNEWRVPEGALAADELRRYSYHVRSRRAAASFARCWLLVEGETEFWLMGELARVCGYDFATEGITCVEFAQCGLGALLKVAQHLGIEWHVLADGDAAGHQYAHAARSCAGAGCVDDRITLLQDVDIEHCFWRHGYSDLFRKAAYPQSSLSPAGHAAAPARATIRKAIERFSKPYIAVLLLDAAIDRGPSAVPPPLARVIETCVRLARRAPSPKVGAASMASRGR